MKKIGTATLALGCLAAVAATPKTGGIAFRYDDNQTAAKWKVLTGVFDTYGFKLGMSLNFAKIDPADQVYLEAVRNAQADGHEVMDHTPNHTVFQLQADADAITALAKSPAVDHVSGNTAYFKYRVKPEYYCCDFTAGVDGKKLTLSDAVKAQLDKEWVIYAPELKTAFMTCKVGDAYELRSFWDENNVDLGRRAQLEFKIVKRFWGFAADPEALRIMADFTRKKAQAFGLTPPKTWIQPGGRAPIILAEEVRAVFGTEFGYTSAATYQDAALKIYGEPDPDRCRFAMQWGNFNLENQTVEEAKKIIAAGVARNYVMIGGGHLWAHKVPGGWDEYIRRHDELLKWCRDTGVPVKLQREWADLLYGGPADPKWNIMPDPATDRDGDGVPDGYKIGENTRVAERSFISGGEGRVFRIDRLSGLERGESTFAFKAAGQPGESIELVFDFINRKQEIARQTFTVNLESDGEQHIAQKLTAPDDAAFVTIDVIRRGGNGPLALKEFVFNRP